MMMISVMWDWEVWEQRQGMPITPIKRRQQDETQYKVSKGERKRKRIKQERQRHRYRDRTSGYVSFSLDFFSMRKMDYVGFILEDCLLALMPFC